MNRRPYFGWAIAAASGLGLATGIATVIAATFSIFVGPMREEFGWNASLPFWAPLAVTLTTVFAAPWVGSFVDRYGARRIVLVSFVFEALILLSFYWHTPAIRGLYLRYIALGYSNKEIAEKFDLSVKTIEAHKANALKKLNIESWWSKEIDVYWLAHPNIVLNENVR